MPITRLLTKASHYYTLLQTNYWFVPLVMILFSLVSARLLLELDAQQWLPVPAWLSLDTAGSARDILTTIAAAAITIAGVTFSITMVTLSLASQQFGPRTLRNFLTDRGNQFTLGTFVSTFVYCLAILGSIRGGTQTAYLPQWSVLVALMQALHCILVLVYFIHHVASSMRGPAIIRGLFSQARTVLQQQYSTANDGASSSANDAVFPGAAHAHHAHLRADKAGYIQNYNMHKLMQLCEKHNSYIQLHFRVGQFAYYSQPIATIVSSHSDLNDKFLDDILSCILIGNIRTPEQDPVHLPVRITEVAVRALSPGTNDPYTATECLNWLSDLLCYLAKCKAPSIQHCDSEEKIRIWLPMLDFAGFWTQVISPIRQYGAGSAIVIQHLIEVCRKLHHETNRAADRQIIANELSAIQETITDTFSPKDLVPLQDALELAFADIEVASKATLSN